MREKESWHLSSPERSCAVAGGRGGARNPQRQLDDARKQKAAKGGRRAIVEARAAGLNGIPSVRARTCVCVTRGIRELLHMCI